jgi:ribosomal protein S12 methylthiotransferase accessory factor
MILAACRDRESPAAQVESLNWKQGDRPVRPAMTPSGPVQGGVSVEMTITFPGGARVDARAGHYTIETDQPPQAGGEGSAPAPFTLFLASIGTCAGIYVLGFCRQRGLPTDGIQIHQRVEPDPQTGLIGKVYLDIEVPSHFPEKYREALIRAATQCAVKKHLERPPRFEVRTVVTEGVRS